VLTTVPAMGSMSVNHPLVCKTAAGLLSIHAVTATVTPGESISKQGHSFPGGGRRIPDTSNKIPNLPHCCLHQILNSRRVWTDPGRSQSHTDSTSLPRTRTGRSYHGGGGEDTGGGVGPGHQGDLQVFLLQALVRHLHSGPNDTSGHAR